MTIHHQDDQVTVHAGDCLAVLREDLLGYDYRLGYFPPAIADASVDAVVTDPPYNLTAGKKGGTGAASVNLESPYGRARIGTGNGSGGFMGQSWDDYDAFPGGFYGWCRAWSSECLRVLKPGGHMLAFGGTRTFHRLACAVEDAGFEIRDSIAWLYGSGFPKSLDVSKAIDKAARGVPQGGADPTSPNHGRFRTTTTEGKRWDGDSGQSYGAGGSRFLADTASARMGAPDTATTPTIGPGAAAAAVGLPPSTLDATAAEWQGWGTALKPAFEPIVVARKPLVGTVAANVLAHETGALNIDGCRVAHANATDLAESAGKNRHADFGSGPRENKVYGTDLRDRGEGGNYDGSKGRWPANVILDESQATALNDLGQGYGDVGGASRFFYTAKASSDERVRVEGIAHPTVKPLALMRWLVRLVTPPGGTVLEPLAGSGTTVEACVLEGFRCVAIERELRYLPLIVQRINRRRDPVAAVKASAEDGGLFALLEGEVGA